MNARGRATTRSFGIVVSALALISTVLGGSGQPFVQGYQGSAAWQQAVQGGDQARTAVNDDGTRVVLVAYESTNFFVPGTGNPGEAGSTHPGQGVIIAYPATQPVTGDYPASVRVGVAGLNDAVAASPGASVGIEGYSQGAHVVNEWAAQPGATAGREVTLYTTGDPCTVRTGILVRSPEARAVAGHCTPLPPGIPQAVTVQECDPIANFPERLDGLTAVNALAGYTYCHTFGYTPDQMTRQDMRVYHEGSVTYRVIPADPTPPLVKALHQHGIYLPAPAEQAIADALVQSGPGPQGDPGLVPARAVRQVSAPADTPPPPPVPDPVVQATEALEQGWQHINEDLANEVEAFTAAALPPPSPLPAPTGNVAAAAAAVHQYTSAPEVDWIASQVEASPLGGFINSLPPLFPVG